MKKYLYAGDKNVYKANLHCHSTVSDGDLSPEKIKEVYMAKGYGIVAFTDHGRLIVHDYLNDEDFLAINACEVGLNQEDGSYFTRKTYHLNLYAARADITETPPPMMMDYSDIDAINEYIADRVGEGFLVCYNHPYWSMQTLDEYSKLRNCFAMEIYNHNCEVDDGCCGYNPQAYDEMLRSGNRLFCLSTDDNHNSGPKHLPDMDSFGGFTYINSKSLSYEDVMQALASGDFYSSQGPEIYEISLEGKILTVKCSPVQRIRVYTQGRVCYEAVGDGLESATFELSETGAEGYIRIMCRDKDNSDANSNAYWLQ